MSVPALALFYGGMVRSKNVLSLLMQVFVVFSLVTVLWCIYGYSLAFTEGNAFIGGFDRLFGRAADGYVMAAGRSLRLGIVFGFLYVGLLALTWLGFNRVPAGFVPAQDKYYLVGIVQLPSGASLERTEAVVREMTRIALDHPGVENVVAFPGLSINGFAAGLAAASERRPSR